MNGDSDPYTPDPYTPDPYTPYQFLKECNENFQMHKLL